MTILKIALLLLFTIDLSYETNDPDTQICTDLYNNCIATADQEFVNGNYSLEVWFMFVNNICPVAQFECVLDLIEPVIEP